MKEKIEQLKNKLKTIEQLKKDLKAKEQELQEKVDKYILDNKGDVNEIGQSLERLLEELKADQKALFNITDGENVTILNMADFVIKLINDYK